MPTERPSAARDEGEHQRIRTGDHPVTNVRGGTIEGEARRAEALRADRLHMGSVRRPQLRSGSPAAGGDQARLPEVPRAGQRPPGAVVDGVAEYPLSLPVERQNVDVV